MTTIADKLNASGYQSHQIGKVRVHIVPTLVRRLTRRVRVCVCSGIAA